MTGFTPVVFKKKTEFKLNFKNFFIKKDYLSLIDIYQTMTMKIKINGSFGVNRIIRWFARTSLQLNYLRFRQRLVDTLKHCIKKTTELRLNITKVGSLLGKQVAIVVPHMARQFGMDGFQPLDDYQGFQERAHTLLTSEGRSMVQCTFRLQKI